MGRSILGIVAGILAAFVLVLAIETAAFPLFPQPEGMDPRSADSVREHLSEIHPGSFVMVLVAWTAAAIGGPWVARRIAGDAPAWPSLTVGLLFLALCVYNLIVVPTPIWVTIGAIVLIPVATWLGLRIPIRRATA